MQNNATPLQSTVIGLFVVTWVVLGIVSFVVFYLGKNTGLKRKWWPRFVILSGVLFVTFIAWVAAVGPRPWETLGGLAVIVPGVALISYLNIRFTKFCGSCGATVFDHNWFSPIRFCSKCGAAIDKDQKDRGNMLE